MLEKNEEFTVVIEDISEDGAGIGKTEGFTWFVKDTVIGDVKEKELRICPAGAGDNPFAGSGGTKMRGGKGLRRMPAAGDGL